MSAGVRDVHDTWSDYGDIYISGLVRLSSDGYEQRSSFTGSGVRYLTPDLYTSSVLRDRDQTLIFFR
jgi:hypothetical protein